MFILKSGKLSDGGNLAYTLQLKIHAKVMLAANIDITDRLINGQIGLVRSFQMQKGNIIKVYVEFNDKRAGLKAMAKKICRALIYGFLVEKIEAIFNMRCLASEQIR